MKKPDSRSHTCAPVLGQHEPSAWPQESMCRRDGRMTLTLEGAAGTQATNLWERATGKPEVPRATTMLTNWYGINPSKARVGKDGKPRCAQTPHQAGAGRGYCRHPATIRDVFEVETPKLSPTSALQNHPERPTKSMRRMRPMIMGARQMSEIGAVTAVIPIVVNWSKSSRRGGRVAECGGLLNRCTG